MERREAIYDGAELVSETFLEVSWEQVRATRDLALIDSDWRALKDLTDKLYAISPKITSLQTTLLTTGPNLLSDEFAEAKTRSGNSL